MDPFANAESGVSFDLGDACSSKDPFKDLGNSVQLSPFTEDPFSDIGPDGSNATNEGNANDFASFGNMPAYVSMPKSDVVVMDTLGQSSEPKSTDPFAAFLDIDPECESAGFPDAPSSWLESMERDASKSLSQNDLGSLVGPQAYTSDLDSSSQTSSSLLNLTDLGSSVSNTLLTPNVTLSGIPKPFMDTPNQPMVAEINCSSPPLPNTVSLKQGISLNKSGLDPSLEDFVGVDDDSSDVRYYFISFNPVSVYSAILFILHQSPSFVL